MGDTKCGSVLLYGVLLCLVSSSIGLTTVAYDGSGYSCTFDSNICGWTQDRLDEFDWTRKRGSTSTTATGPSGDHTTEFCTTCPDYYLYIESSSPQSPSNKARLVGPFITIPAGESVCFSFWYHMYGSDIGGLSLYEQQDKMTNFIWTKSGNQGNQWLYGDVTIQGTGLPTQILIDGIRGNSYHGDIAIDDTHLQPGPCRGSEYSCAFDSNICGWTQDRLDEFDWAINGGSTPSSETGPSADHTTEFCTTCPDSYLYIEASAPRHSSNKARLVGPFITIPVGESACFSFWYHMYGSGIGRLSLYEQQENITDFIWTKTGNQGDQWLHGNVTIQGTGFPIQILIDGIRGPSLTGDIAIDDTNLRPGPCRGERYSTQPVQYTNTPYRTGTTYPWWLTTTRRYYTTTPWQRFQTTPGNRYSTQTVQYTNTPYRTGTTYPWWLTTTLKHYTTTPWYRYQTTKDYWYPTTAQYTNTPYRTGTTYPWWLTTARRYYTTTPWYRYQTTKDNRYQTQTVQYTNTPYRTGTTYPWWLTTTRRYYTTTPWQRFQTTTDNRYQTQTVQYTNTPYRTGTTYPWWLTTARRHYTTTPWQRYHSTTDSRYPTQVSSTYSPYRTSSSYPWWLTTGYYTTPYPWQHSQTKPADRVYGSITVDCNKYTWDVIIDLNILREDYPTAKGSDIYLGENRCTGQERNNLLIFNQELTECLTSEMLLNGVHVYNNELIYAEHDPVYAYIIRHYNWTIGVECDVQRDGTANSSLQKPDQNTPSPTVYNQQYPIHITYYSDPNFMHEIQGNPLHTSVGSQVYVKVFTTTFDWNTKMRMRTCYTTPTEHASDHLKYYLIRNGCEVDTNTHIISQSTHETRFVFDNFEYTSSHDGLYLYCDVTFCDASDLSTECSQSCHPIVRRRR